MNKTNKTECAKIEVLLTETSDVRCISYRLSDITDYLPVPLRDALQKVLVDWEFYVPREGKQQHNVTVGVSTEGDTFFEGSEKNVPPAKPHLGNFG